MEKIVFAVLFLAMTLYADIDEKCLYCHEKQQIPSELIYKRYLMTYSGMKYIKEAMFAYLKNPSKKASIMPKQFFLKFPMKKASKLSDEELRESIEKYIEKFDIRKKLILRRN